MLYRYDGTFDGLMTAVYDAFYARIPVEQAHFTMNENMVSLTLWDDNHEIAVITDSIKARKVIQALVAQVGYDAYDYSYHVFLSCEPGREDLIFQYIKLCFAKGPEVFRMWAHPVAGEVLRISRKVSREWQHMLGFLRFQELESGALFAEISPTNNVIELMAPHFADRLPNERFMIYDSSRQIACVYAPEKGLLFTDQIPPELIAIKEHSATEPMYQDLWRAFFKAIAIEGRYNPKCQQNFLPKKYWKHLTEMQD